MNILAVIRRRKKVWIPRLAAPLGIVWLNMLWQPCAMAMDAGEPMPMDTGMHADAHTPMHMGMDHEGMGHGAHPCPHCPPLMHEDCKGNAAEDCSYFDRFDADRRAPKLKYGDNTDVQPILHSSSQPLQLSLVLSARGDPPQHAVAPPGPALNVLYCSFLN